MPSDLLAIGKRLHAEVLDPMKATFVGKDEVIDLLGVCLVGGENLFILGPPGTAKSALVHELGRRLKGQTFDYLLTRFTEPNELFGPFDIRKLREGVLETNTEGMLPEASLAFLDELLNANSAILNSLLTVLNERVLRRGRETYQLPLLMVVGASNQLPQDEALQALFDRFLLRVRCDNVDTDRLDEVLDSGWKLEKPSSERTSILSIDDIRHLQQILPNVDLATVRPLYLECLRRIRSAGLPLSDRRAVKLQRLIAASALLCGREEARASDLWVLRYIWDIEEQRELLNAIVDEAIQEAGHPAPEEAHPRGREHEPPNAEHLSQELDRLTTQLADDPSQNPRARDRLQLIASRAEWVTNDSQRAALKLRIASAWESLERVGAPEA